MRRKPLLAKLAVAAVVLLYVAAELGSRAVAADHCDALAPDAPVAILLAGPTFALNRTACSLAANLVAPLRARGHPVTVFLAFDRPTAPEHRAEARRALVDAVKPHANDVEVIVERVDAPEYPREGQKTASPRDEGESDSSFVGSSALGAAHEDAQIDPGYLAVPPTTCVHCAPPSVRPSDGRASSRVAGASDAGSSASPAKKDAAETARLVDFLSHARARAAAESMRRRYEASDSKPKPRPFAWVVFSRPDVVLGDAFPTRDAMCSVPGGRRAPSPGSTAPGNERHRFAAGAPEGMREYLGVYDALCDEGKAEGEGGGGGSFEGNLEGNFEGNCEGFSVRARRRRRRGRGGRRTRGAGSIPPPAGRKAPRASARDAPDGENAGGTSTHANGDGVFGGDSEVARRTRGYSGDGEQSDSCGDVRGFDSSRVSSTETLYAWHMRRRHVLVDRWALARFVFYRAPARGPPTGLDDNDAPDAGLGLKPVQPERKGGLPRDERGVPEVRRERSLVTRQSGRRSINTCVLSMIDSFRTYDGARSTGPRARRRANDPRERARASPNGERVVRDANGLVVGARAKSHRSAPLSPTACSWSRSAASSSSRPHPKSPIPSFPSASPSSAAPFAPPRARASRTPPRRAPRRTPRGGGARRRTRRRTSPESRRKRRLGAGEIDPPAARLPAEIEPRVLVARVPVVVVHPRRDAARERIVFPRRRPSLVGVGEPTFGFGPGRVFSRGLRSSLLRLLPRPCPSLRIRSRVGRYPRRRARSLSASLELLAPPHGPVRRRAVRTVRAPPDDAVVPRGRVRVELERVVRPAARARALVSGTRRRAPRTARTTSTRRRGDSPRLVFAEANGTSATSVRASVSQEDLRSAAAVPSAPPPPGGGSVRYSRISSRNA